VSCYEPGVGVYIHSADHGGIINCCLLGHEERNEMETRVGGEEETQKRGTREKGNTGGEYDVKWLM